MGKKYVCDGCGEEIYFRTIDEKVIPFGCRCGRRGRGSLRNADDGEVGKGEDEAQSIQNMGGPWSYLLPQQPHGAIEQFDCAVCRQVHYRLDLGDRRITVAERASHWRIPACVIAGPDLLNDRQRIELLNRHFVVRKPPCPPADSSGIGCVSAIVLLVVCPVAINYLPAFQAPSGSLNSIGILALLCMLPIVIILLLIYAYLTPFINNYLDRRRLPDWWPVKRPWEQPSLRYSRRALENPHLDPDEKEYVSGRTFPVGSGEAPEKKQIIYPPRD